MASLESERNALHPRLSEEGANLRLAQQLLGFGMWRFEPATGRVFWCARAHHVFGTTADDLPADFDTYLARMHVDDRAGLLSGLRDSRDSDAATYEFRHRVLRKDGTVVHVRGIAEWQQKDGAEWLTGVIQDVTAEIQAREKLSEANHMQRIAERSARLGGWSIDLDPVRINWSPRTCAIHEEPAGTTPSAETALAYFAPEFRAHLNARFTTCIQMGKPVDEIAQIVTAKGNHVWVRVIGEPVRDEQGKVIAVQGAFQDISDMIAERDQSECLARRLRQTLENINDAFFLLDHDWRFSFLNGQAENLLRRSRKSLIGKVIWDEFPEAVGSSFQTEYEAADRTRQSVRFQEFFPPLDTWFEIDAHPTPEGLAVYFRDVTGQRARDQHLRLLEAAVSRQNDILLITEAEPIDAPDGPKIVYVNDAFVKRTGFSREEAIGKSPRILQGPKTQRAELDRIRSTLENWQPVRAELINYTKDGQEFWLELDIVPLADETGWFTHWVAIERDITGRKRAEAAKQLSDERFRLVVNATNDVISDWDVISGTIWWNENLHALFGYDPSQLEAGPEFWRQHIHPEDSERVLHSINAALAGSATTWSDEYRFFHADGHVMIVIDRGFIIRNPEGKALRMLGSLVDVTSEREIERRLHQAQKLETVGQLTGGVAHDFNNLLMVILGNAEMLGNELNNQPRLRTMTEMIATAAERGAKLTHRLLAFASRQPLEPRPTDVCGLIHGMEELLRRTLSESIDIEIACEDGLWNAEIDPSQLDSAILNLALNARDAMPRGGCLTIETRNVKLDPGFAAQEPDLVAGEYVKIVVADNGDGIAAEDLGHIFEPFFTTKEVGKGSGLGLSMVYGFVRQSSGHVRVCSEPGRGTAVTLYFPRACGAAVRIRAPKLEKRMTGGDETILVVEDDALVRDHLVARLRGLGYTVIGAGSGPDAMKFLEDGPHIDLLLTDVVMPGGMNGNELASAARELRPLIKVLVTSGYSEDALAHNGRLDSGAELLRKPYRRGHLADKVRKVLDANHGSLTSTAAN